jgi:hypothetical protein
MKIFITPHDIIERALWYEYQYYILDKDADVEKIIEENEEFEISEKDALVIGLLKCIETDNLVHRLNQHIEHLMAVRNTKHEGNFYLKKKILLDELNKYRRRFPSTWKPRPHYAKALEDVNDYIDELLAKAEDLAFVETKDNFGTHELIRTNHVKKILNYHN